VADKDLDRLYALPLEEFTAARNELAKSRGDPELRTLKKPTVPAWAVNKLAREREVDLRRLLRAGERLEAAQKDAVRGGGQRRFDEARREEREAVRRLRAAAAELLRAGGHPASDATLERVAKTLRAGAGTSQGRATLREGRLSEELEPAGFDALAELAGAKPSPRRTSGRTAKGPTAEERRRARKARAEADEAQREARDAAAQLEEAERALRNAERELAKARRASEQAADRATRLEAKANELGV
jgi:hypothetical protein